MSGSILQALELIKKNRFLDEEAALEGGFFCGFTPLHLKTFFHGALCRISPGKKIMLKEGLYGDLSNSLKKQLDEGESEFIAIAFEWEDFDPRLGLRSTGGWGASSYEDILSTVRSKAALYAGLIEKLSKKSRVVVSLPLLPFLPLHFNSPDGTSPWEIEVKGEIKRLGATLATLKDLKLVNTDLLNTHPAFPNRYSPESHLAYGFPYSIEFAAVLGELMARLALPVQPLKGIVVDLDDTLWRGILGEDGPEGVSWDLDNNSHMHGVFQSFLQSLADTGILVAVASKNDAALVEEIFSKRRPLLNRDSIFPLMANWGRKSISMGKILKSWNIGEDAVAFIDDSPMELEEVRSQFKGVRTFQFPPGKPDEILELIVELRRLFGKEKITDEDKIRLDSLKKNDELHKLPEGSEKDYEDILKESRPIITLQTLSPEGDERAFELLNKTNQFNMNGIRCSETEWRGLCSRKDGFVLVASYKDKFGPLGKIAVMAGFYDGERLHITHWVMSCRAFGRRIEHYMLNYLFKKYPSKKVCLKYFKTERNGPFYTFITESGGTPAKEEMEILVSAFRESMPKLYHQAGGG